MNLDEMLKASGISGGAASGNDNVKSGFVTFIGRPNVGKSTLMKIITGQIQPDSGSVEIGDTVHIGYLCRRMSLLMRIRQCLSS